MPPADKHEEEKVQKALKLLEENPRISLSKAAYKTRAAYYYIRRRLNNTLRSSSRGGYNKKLNIPSSSTLKDYLLIYYTFRKGASIEYIIIIINSVL